MPKHLWKKGNIPWNKNKKATVEHRQAISEGLKRNPPNKGKKFSKEFCQKLSLAHQGHCPSKITRERMSAARKGANHWNWRGGSSEQLYGKEWGKTLRRAIMERDNYICQICSQYGHEVHHINYIKDDCHPDNLITLCHSCHSKTNCQRDNWIEWFDVLRGLKNGQN